MKKKLVIAVFAILILGAIFFMRERHGKSENPQNAPPQSLPTFSLQDYTGTVVPSSSLMEKPVVFVFWTSWCARCRTELSNFSPLKKEFGDRITLVAVNRAEPLDIAKRSSDELGTPNAGIIFLLDPSDSFYRSLNGFTMPETIFMDGKGFIRAHTHGLMEPEEIKRRIQNLTGE